MPEPQTELSEVQNELSILLEEQRRLKAAMLAGDTESLVLVTPTIGVTTEALARAVGAVERLRRARASTAQARPERRRRRNGLAAHRRSRTRQRVQLVVLLLALAASAGCGQNIRALDEVGAGSSVDDHVTDTETTSTSTSGPFDSVTGNGWGSSTGETAPDEPFEELPTEEPPPPVDHPPDVHTIRISGDDDPHVDTPAQYWLTVHAKDDHAIERVEFTTSKDDDPIGVTTSSYGDHVYGVPWDLNHAKYNGITTFTATAFDHEGQSASASIVLSADLLPSGYLTPLWGTHNPTVGEVWSDVAVRPDGELVIVGHRTYTLEQFNDDVVFDRLVVERRSPDGVEVHAEVVGAPVNTRGVAVAVRDDEIFILSDRVEGSHIARYSEDGEELDVWDTDLSQVRDLVVASDGVIATGNTGTLGQTETSVRTYWLTLSLSLQHVRDIDGDGADLNSGQALALAGDDVVVAGFVEQENGKRASLLASYSATTADERWRRVIDSEFGERLADVAVVGSKLVAIGTVKNEDSTAILMRRLASDGFPEYAYEITHTNDGQGLRVLAVPGDEIVIAGRTCTLEPMCTTRIRRYKWHGVHPELLWADWTGKSASETPTALAAASLGFTLATRHGSVNLGEGHHEQSGLREYHP